MNRNRAEKALSLVLAKALVSGVVGDADGDGKISPNDLLIAQLIILNRSCYDSLIEGRCDVDFDGVVGSADALFLKQRLLGIVS